MTERTVRPAESERSTSQILLGHKRNPRFRFPATVVLCVLLFATSVLGRSQTPGIAEKPYQGWTSFSQQTISINFLTQANMSAQSDALLSSGPAGSWFQQRQH